jgi:hypothetical protein
VRFWWRLPVVVMALAIACGAQTAAKGPPIFEFHSGFWLNLHQFLCQSATASDPVRSDSPEWDAAVEYYRREIVLRGELSPELTDVANRLSAAGSARELPAAGLEPVLVATLAKVAPIYRRTWWPQHDQSNLAWIAAVTPLVDKYGAAIQRDLTSAYMVEWPPAPIRTDVSVYGGTYGAYTTTMPTPHITISSVDKSYQGNASLEMLFHESSHALDEKIEAALDSELKAHGKLFRRRAFGHAIIFYSAGEITRRYLAGYETYAIRNGIWDKGWPGGLEVLEKDWKPYLQGRIGMAAAVRAIVEDYGVPRNLP